MISGKAAGHTFEMGMCSCGRRLVDFRGLNETYVGQHWITHDGSYATTLEIQAVTRLVDEMDKFAEKLFK